MLPTKPRWTGSTTTSRVSLTASNFPDTLVTHFVLPENLPRPKVLNFPFGTDFPNPLDLPDYFPTCAFPSRHWLENPGKPPADSLQRPAGTRFLFPFLPPPVCSFPALHRLFPSTFFLFLFRSFLGVHCKVRCQTAQSPSFFAFFPYLCKTIHFLLHSLSSRRGPAFGGFLFSSGLSAFFPGTVYRPLWRRSVRRWKVPFHVASPKLHCVRAIGRGAPTSRDVELRWRAGVAFSFFSEFGVIAILSFSFPPFSFRFVRSHRRQLHCFKCLRPPQPCIVLLFLGDLFWLGARYIFPSRALSFRANFFAPHGESIQGRGASIAMDPRGIHSLSSPPPLFFFLTRRGGQPNDWCLIMIVFHSNIQQLVEAGRSPLLEFQTPPAFAVRSSPPQFRHPDGPCPPGAPLSPHCAEAVLYSLAPRIGSVTPPTPCRDVRTGGRQGRRVESVSPVPTPFPPYRNLPPRRSEFLNKFFVGGEYFSMCPVPPPFTLLCCSSPFSFFFALASSSGNRSFSSPFKPFSGLAVPRLPPSSPHPPARFSPDLRCKFKCFEKRPADQTQLAGGRTLRP